MEAAICVHGICGALFDESLEILNLGRVLEL